MSARVLWTGVFTLTWLASAPVFSQTQLLTNPSFESGLTGWTTATSLQNSGTGTCGYNGVTAPGTEAITLTPGFAATDGTQIALGSVADTHGTGAIISCVLYQDVAIPAGATTATFSFDMGIKDTPGNNTNNAATVGIFSTASVPGFSDPAIVGGGSGKVTLGTGHANDAALTHQTSVSINISSKAGTTVRFAIINAANANGHEVVGIDNVSFLVTVPAPPPAPTAAFAPTLSEWAAMLLASLLALSGFFALRRRDA